MFAFIYFLALKDYKKVLVLHSAVYVLKYFTAKCLSPVLPKVVLQLYKILVAFQLAIKDKHQGFIPNIHNLCLQVVFIALVHETDLSLIGDDIYDPLET